MENIKENQTLLTAVFQNTSTAIQSIENSLNEMDNLNFINELVEQLNNYKRLSLETEKLASKMNLDIKDNNGFEKARLWTSIKLNTLFDKSERQFAEMFYVGTTMGIINMIEAIEDGRDSEYACLLKANELLKLEEKNLELFKRYLKVTPENVAKINEN